MIKRRREIFIQMPVILSFSSCFCFFTEGDTSSDHILCIFNGFMHQFGERHNYTLINIYLGVKYSFFLLNNLTKLTVTLLKIIFKYHYCYYLFIFISFRRKAEKSLESTLHFFILLIFTCIPEQKKLGKN